MTLKNVNGNTLLVRADDSFYNSILGADLQQVPEDELKDLAISNGLKIINIRNGILERSGINKGFIITEINDRVVDSQHNLTSALNNSRRNIVLLKGIYPNGVRISFEFML